ncbi:MAG: TonB-dependent receptor domain-containing protein [Pseudomonadota bacterium]
MTSAQAWACEQWVARLASTRGVVEAQTDGDWRKARAGDRFCSDVSVRVGGASSAVLELANQTVVRLSEQSAVSFRHSPNAAPAVEMSQGRGHFLSRTPQRFDAATPYLNAAIDGTEFLLAAGPEADGLTLFEGQVTAAGRVLKPGESLRVSRSGQTEVRVGAGSRDGLDWALHYPALAGTGLMEARARLAAGDAEAAQALALAAESGAPPQQRAEALALQAVIALARGQTAAADRLSSEATMLASSSANAWLARSYARQAVFDLVGARAAAEQAAQQVPADALTALRLAELDLAAGDYRAARRRAQPHLDGPQAGLARRLLGFAELVGDDAPAAQAQFEQASAADPSDPLARLGLGLALIRQNQLAAGRRQMEIAVSLDPGQSLLRSYLAKAYLSEQRPRPAQAELGRAKELDGADPTPWFYQALGLLAQNRPVEARAALAESVRRNDNRAVFRSKLQLDEDLAARQASAGRVYEALGFDQLARREAAAALASDPTDFSAHRLLADSYLGLPNHETGRLSELLQAQLWQPLSVLPLQPQARAEDLGIRQGAVSLRSGLNEYTPLFVRDGVSVLGSAVGGGDDLFSDDLVANVLAGPLSISAAQFRYTTDGFRDNADQEIDLYDLFAQWRMTPATSVQAEVRRSREERGDIGLYPFDDVDSATLRQFRDRDTYRVGLRHDWAPGNSTLLSVQRESVHEGQDFDIDIPTPFGGITVPVKARGDSRPLLAEAQQVVFGAAGRLLLGGGHYRENGDLDVNGFVFDQRTRHSNGYTYAYLGGPAGMQWTLGLAVDAVDADVIDETRWSPKLGLVWVLDDGTTLRAAALRAVNRQLIGKGTIEPVQVAGFVQFFDDVPGTRSDRYALGLDRRVQDGLDVGFEASWRTLERPYLDFLGSAQTGDARQQLHRLYAYWTPAPRWALRAEYRYQKGRYGDDLPLLVESGNWGIRDLRTHSLPLGVRYSHPSGWLADFAVTGYRQSGDFVVTTSGEQRHARDDFWLSDARVAYRLPRRLGLVSVGARNLFDTEVQFQDADPQNPQLHPRRHLYASVSLMLD